MVDDLVFAASCFLPGERQSLKTKMVFTKTSGFRENHGGFGGFRENHDGFCENHGGFRENQWFSRKPVVFTKTIVVFAKTMVVFAKTMVVFAKTMGVFAKTSGSRVVFAKTTQKPKWFSGQRFGFPQFLDSMAIFGNQGTFPRFLSKRAKTPAQRTQLVLLVATSFLCLGLHFGFRGFCKSVQKREPNARN